MSQTRQPSGQPTGGQFAETGRAASGLALALSPTQAGEPLPVLPDHDAQMLAEVDLGFHVADIEWDEADRAIEEDLDSTEDPMYDTEGPWHGEETAEDFSDRRAA